MDRALLRDRTTVPSPWRVVIFGTPFHISYHRPSVSDFSLTATWPSSVEASEKRDMAGQGNVTEAPPTKRIKVDVACDLCRSKKVPSVYAPMKESGSNPVCRSNVTASDQVGPSRIVLTLSRHLSLGIYREKGNLPIRCQLGTIFVPFIGYLLRPSVDRKCGSLIPKYYPLLSINNWAN